MRSELAATIDRRLAELIITKLRRERPVLKLMPTSWVFPIVAPAARRLRRQLSRSAVALSGAYIVDEKAVAPSAQAQDDSLARSLWDQSARLIGLPGDARA